MEAEKYIFKGFRDVFGSASGECVKWLSSTFMNKNDSAFTNKRAGDFVPEANNRFPGKNLLLSLITCFKYCNTHSPSLIILFTQFPSFQSECIQDALVNEQIPLSFHISGKVFRIPDTPL